MRRRAVLAAAALAVAALAGGSALVGAAPAAQVNQAVIDSDAMPAKLSAFGLFQPGGSVPISTVLPYELATPLFSDYADKARLIALPAGQKAVVGPDGRVQFPLGTVLVKSFGWTSVNGGRPVETRLLIHRASGWVALPYIWDADGRDATLKVAGGRLPIRFTRANGDEHSISYAVPNKNQCKDCHSQNGAIVPIGPRVGNLVFPGVGKAGAGAGRAALARAFTNPAALAGPVVRWDDARGASLDSRARAYLDVNCAHCHSPGGSASNSGLFQGRDVRDGKALGIGKRPVAAGRGSGGRDFAIAPGDPDASILIYRLENTDPGIAMPELGRGMVHREGAALLREWIASMPKATS